MLHNMLLSLHTSAGVFVRYTTALQFMVSPSCGSHSSWRLSYEQRANNRQQLFGRSVDCMGWNHRRFYPAVRGVGCFLELVVCSHVTCRALCLLKSQKAKRRRR